MRVALVKPPHLGSHTRGVGFYADRLFSSLSQDNQISVQWVNFQPFPFQNSSFDIVHYTYFDFFYLTLPPIRLAKTVVTLHDVIPLKFPAHYPLGKRGRIVWPIQKMLLNSVNAIITDSETSKQDIISLLNYPKDKIFVTLLASDPEFKPLKNLSILRTIKTKYKLPEKFVLYVGGVNWNKNLPTLVKACQKIDAKLVIVGKEAMGEGLDLTHPESGPFREVISLIKNDKRIIRLGFVPTEDLVAIYNLAAIYVQPSFYEGFGLPVLEAMSCGLPVLCGQNSSLMEITSGAAVYADITSVDDLADKISQTVNWTKSDKESWSQKSLRQASKFTWQETAQKTLAVYHQVLDLKTS